MSKIANKEEKAELAAKPKKEIHADPQGEDNKQLAEMKNQTRILRDISTKGVFV